MKIIITLDNKNGMMFNHRRQSRDSAVTEYITKLTEGKGLRMGAYSEKLYGAVPGAYIGVDYLSGAGSEDYCLVEDTDPAEITGIDEIIAIYWNRDYPSDLKCTLDFSQLKEENCEEFPGSSHDNITVRRYSV